ncbi:MAG: type II secretion system secretin GspD [Pontiella sp.]
MNYRHLFILALSIPAISLLNVQGQEQPPAFPPGENPAAATPGGSLRGATIQSQIKPEQLQSFKFEGADLDTVMTQYCEWTDKIYLKTDAIKATITLKAEKLTKAESIKVIEAILAMNNIALVPMGEKYIKVIAAPAGDLTGQGLQINMDPEYEFGDSDKFVTSIIQLQNVTIPEVQAAVQHVLHSFGKILTLERSNSIMITDTELNIKRARELIEFIDQATAQIEPRIYQIQFADSSEIASKLNEIVTAAQGDKTTPVVAGNPYARTPAGVTRASASGAAKKAPTQATISKTEGSSTVIIQGTVKIMADERTNLIIIFSQEVNFAFFDKIINVLDVEVEPATTFEVINLEYADASELSGTLNDLIGAAGGSRSSSGSSSSRSNTSRTTTPNSRTGSSNARVTPNAAPSAEVASIENLNRLSEDTKILADERSNSIILMGSKSDIAVIKQVIKSLDVMLEQVIIEAAIFEIGLNDSLSHGINWLYENSDQSKVGAWNGSSLTTNTLSSLVSGAMNYYQTIPGLNSEVLINLAKTDADARIISTPIIMTTDNTEAILSIGEQRPVVTSTSSFANSSGTQSSNYEYKDIGIQLTVTPRINPERMVIMEIKQKADQIGEFVEIDNNQVPTILNREFTASIAVRDGETVALGGLINSDHKDTVNKIPILGDIPLIGRYLFSSVKKVEIQRELIVLMTPYVVTNDEEMQKQTERLYKGSNLEQKDWGEYNWSESPLRLIADQEEESDIDEQFYSVNPAKEASALETQATASPNPEVQIPSSTKSDEEEMRQLLKSMEK